MCRSVGHGGQSHYGRGPRGSGPEDVDQNLAAATLPTTGCDMADRGSNPKEKISCPKCGNQVQRDGMRRHNQNMHQGQRKRIHVCP